MNTALDLMNSNVMAVDPEQTVEEVMHMMIEHAISGLPVVDMAGQLLGIITEFDLLDLVWDPTTEKNMVYHYMTRDVGTVDVDSDVGAIAELLRKLAIRRLVVIEDTKVVGIVSRRDLIRWVLKVRSETPTAEGVPQ